MIKNKFIGAAVILILLLPGLCIGAEKKASLWELIPSIDLNTIIHKEKGEIITTQIFPAGHHELYIKTPADLYFCRENWVYTKGRPIKVEETICFRLKK